MYENKRISSFACPRHGDLFRREPINDYVDSWVSQLYFIFL